MKKSFNKLFANMCCSQCGADFTDESITVLREEDEFSVLQIVCSKCKKSFGIAFLGHSNFALKNPSDSDLAFELQEGPDAVSVDDVIDAHDELEEKVDEIDSDLADLEDLAYDDEDDDYDDDDDFDFDDDLDDMDLFEIECPNCHEDVMVDFDSLDEEKGIVCPNCNQEIELEFECDCDDCE